jgi:hypothetical protein
MLLLHVLVDDTAYRLPPPLVVLSLSHTFHCIPRRHGTASSGYPWDSSVATPWRTVASSTVGVCSSGRLQPTVACINHVRSRKLTKSGETDGGPAVKRSAYKSARRSTHRSTSQSSRNNPGITQQRPSPVTMLLVVPRHAHDVL